MVRWQLCSRPRSATPRQSSRRTCGWDRSATDPACPTDADQIRASSIMDKDFPSHSFAHKKDRSQTERPLPNLDHFDVRFNPLCFTGDTEEHRENLQCP